MSKAEHEVVTRELPLALDEFARVACFAHEAAEGLDSLDRELWGGVGFEVVVLCELRGCSLLD